MRYLAAGAGADFDAGAEKGSFMFKRAFNSTVLTRGGGLALLMATTALASAAGAAQAQDATATPSGDTAKKDPKIEVIVVTADRKNTYSADLVQAGSFRGARQIDTPLTVAVMPQELIQSQQAVDLIDVVKNTAGVSSNGVGMVAYDNLTIRGIVVDTRANYRLDGSLQIISSIAFPLEDKDRIEILKGASALYYGFSNPSGIVNLTMKRPTDSQLLNVTAFGDDHNGGGLAVDYGNTWNVGHTGGTFGARINLVDAYLNDGIKYSQGHRNLASGAFDYKPNDQLTLQFDYEHIRKDIVEPAIFRYSTTMTTPTSTNYYPTITLPALLSNTANVGPSWAYNDAWETNRMLKALYKINDAWLLTADYGDSDLNRDRNSPQFLLNANSSAATIAGTGSLSIGHQDSHFHQQNGRIELAGTFYTGPFLNEMLVGYADAIKDSNTPAQNKLTVADNYFNPVVVPEPTSFPAQAVTDSRIHDEGVYLFDRIEVGPYLQILGGVRKSDYTESSLDTDLVTYHASPTSVSYGAVYKPLKWVSFYGTYIEGLQTTAVAPITAVNANAQLAPTTSRQVEFGVKMQPRKSIFIDYAHFDITQGATYVNGANVYVEDGRNRYQGDEINVTGEVTKDLSVYFSAMLLDAKFVQNAPTIITTTTTKGVTTTTISPTIQGFRVDGTPKNTVSLSGEYRLPVVKGLSVTAGMYHVGNQAINPQNEAFAPAYTTFDFGVAYKTDIQGHSTIFRLNGENVTDKRYWASVGAATLGQGLPATWKFSVSSSF